MSDERKAREPSVNYGRAVEVAPLEEKPLLDQYLELRLAHEKLRKENEELLLRIGREDLLREMLGEVQKERDRLRAALEEIAQTTSHGVGDGCCMTVARKALEAP